MYHLIDYINLIREGLSTPLVFKNFKLDMCSSKSPEYLLDRFIQNSPTKAAREDLVNDLEPPSFFLSPRLKEIKEYLQLKEFSSHVSGVMMSGSGTSIFTLSQNPIPQELIQTVLNNYQDIQHFRCQFLNRKNEINQWY
jgi:4-diphosphocytidyl-2C-methyl-D-erythritol kinase